MKAIICFFILLIASPVRAFVPTEAFTFDFNIRTVNMGPVKQQKLYSSVELLQYVFASEEFRERILNHEFNGKKSFHMNKGLTNREIYEKILEGVEKLHPEDNNAMDVEIELYSDFESSVLGYTYPRSKRIWMNVKYFNKHSASEVAGHLTHEWLHKLGFDHERERNEDRKYSVPYAVGYIVKELAKEIEEEIENEDESFER